MAAFTNLGFETAGVDPWMADGWTYTFLAQAEAIDPFSPTPARPAEDFERDWDIDGYIDSLDLENMTNLDEAQYSSPPLLVESFERGWADGYQFELGSNTIAGYGSSPQPFESFESEWDSNESFNFTFPGGADAIYNSTLGAFESFEREWNGNEFVLYFFVAAFYDGAVEDVGVLSGQEDFVRLIPPTLTVADPVADTLTSISHGLSNGWIVYFRAGDDGFVPRGLNTGFRYYVVNKTADTFQVSATPGGSVIDILDPGFGEIFWLRNPAVCWRTELEV